MEGTVKIEKNCNLNVNSQQLDTKFPKKNEGVQKLRIKASKATLKII